MSDLADLKSAKTIHDVASVVGFKASALAYILYSKSAQPTYTAFQIPKRGGGMRTIAAPIPQLKLLQRRLAAVLQNCQDEIKGKQGRGDEGPNPDRVVHGFVRNRSIVSNARQHRHKRFVFNVDLEDFFPSINFGRVRGFFIKDTNFALQPPVATILAQIACFNGCLPQGSPCSPVISNLIGHILDVHLVRLAAKNKCTYSRYADDLTFSTNEKQFPEAIAMRVEPDAEQWSVGIELARLISISGFVVNTTKTRMQYRTGRQEVTGLVVNQKINVPADYRRKVRSMVHHLFTKGTFEVESATPDPVNKGRFLKIPGDLSALHGMLGFVDSVDLYNRRLTPSVKGTAFDTKELMYRRFLFYKDFFTASLPMLVCEGKTDSVYLTHAIRSLARHFPLLAAVSPAGEVEIKIRRYRYSGRSTGRILGLSGGHGDLQKLLFAYKQDLTRFKAPGMTHPVIVLIDNDAAAAPVLNVIKQISGKAVARTDQFFHVVGNLYVVFTPLVEGRANSTIEDFFDEGTRAIRFKGKDFDANSDHSTATHYGKADFAYHVVKPNASTINFEGFVPLLTNISAVLSGHKAGTP